MFKYEVIKVEKINKCFNIADLHLLTLFIYLFTIIYTYLKDTINILCVIN